MPKLHRNVVATLTAAAFSPALIPVGQTHHAAPANRAAHNAICNTTAPANPPKANAADQNYFTSPESAPDFYGFNGGQAAVGYPDQGSQKMAARAGIKPRSPRSRPRKPIRLQGADT